MSRGSDTNTTVEIFDYLITAAIDSLGRIFAIKQFKKALTSDICDGKSLSVEIINLICTQSSISLEKAQLDQQTQLQLLQSEKKS
jgi:hypothetical protein